MVATTYCRTAHEVDAKDPWWLWTTVVADYDLLVIGIGPHFAYEAGPRAEAMRNAGYEPLSLTSRKQFLRELIRFTRL